MISTGISTARILAAAAALATTALGLALALTPGTARADATGYCLDSGGNAAAAKVPAYLYQGCGNGSTNLRWTIRNGQIMNVA